MARSQQLLIVVVTSLVFLAPQGVIFGEDAKLPAGVKAVWDINKAYRETTPTRERICINGLWLLKPAQTETEAVPTDNWGYVKVPGPWPTKRRFNWARSEESQRHYPHPSWKDTE